MSKKCNKCDCVATLHAPQDLCANHWAEWWLEDKGLNKKDFTRKFDKIVRMILKHDKSK